MPIDSIGHPHNSVFFRNKGRNWGNEWDFKLKYIKKQLYFCQDKYEIDKKKFQKSKMIMLCTFLDESLSYT